MANTHIKTLWVINDLLQHKFFLKEQNQLVIYEVQYIHTETCSAGTQVFYTCRPILIKYKSDFLQKKGEPKEIASVDHGTTKDGSINSLPKFREDELVDCNEETAQYLKSLKSSSFKSAGIITFMTEVLKVQQGEYQ